MSIKINWVGVCSHGNPFKDTSIGCETKCEKCNKRGKVAGYHKAKKEVLG